MGSDVAWLRELLWATESALRAHWDADAHAPRRVERNRLIVDLEMFRAFLLRQLGTRAA